MKLNVPALVGVPLSTPEAENVKPSGSAPAVSAKLKDDTPPLAVMT